MQDKDKAIIYLNSNKLFWGRNSDNNLFVHTEGYITAKHQEIESQMNLFNYVMISEEFDQTSGKTTAIYKHA